MKIIKWLDDKFEESILIVSLVFTVAIIFAQVLMRYVFKNSLSWSEELARYIFLYQIWLGASYAVKRTSHLRIEIIKTKLSPKNKIIFDTFALTIWLIFSIFLASKSFSLTVAIFQRGQLSPAMRMPMGYAYASVPIGSGLMCIRLIQQMFINKKKLKTVDDTEGRIL